MSEGTIETMDRRARDHREWLERNAPEVFDDMRHLDDGTSEQAYWHYGYLAATRDIRDWLTGKVGAQGERGADGTDHLGRADAALIAAAPDLYEACVRLLALADTLPIKHPQQAEVRDLARAALAPRHAATETNADA